MATNTGKVKTVGRAGTPPKQDEAFENLELTDGEMDLGTVFDDFIQEINRTVTKKPKKYKVPARPNVVLEFDVNVDYPVYQAWIKKCTKGKGDKAELDYKAFAAIVLSQKNIGIWFGDVKITDVKGDGHDLILADKVFHNMIGVMVGGTNAAIKKLFGADSDVVNLVVKLVDDFGYTLGADGAEEGDEDSPLDD